MPSYEHQQMVRTLKQLVERPQTANEHADWIRAKPQVQLLKQNAQADEIILFASAPPTFIHAVIASEADVTPPNQDDLLEWSSGGPYTSRAGYVYSNGPEGESVWFENYAPQPTKLLQVQNIVFGRDRDGIDDDDPTYYEILQEFVHAAELHWRADQRAYCRIDENGDLEPVVSITKRSDTEPVTLITCKREPLELFLATTDQVLVRFYDITVLNLGKFTSWEGEVKGRVIATQDLFYDQSVHPDGHALTRGVQILRRLLPEQHLFDLIAEPPSRRKDQQYASFTILDWRHDNITTVSAHPDDTTSYFDAAENDLPFEVSPAFFRPEVLSKYKADRSKYVVDELGRSISCRTTWHLKGYDINEAGQVFAYICYLRSLPYQEQLHWQSHNEEPKGSISKRAFENDIQGEWTDQITSLERMVEILKRLSKAKLHWWNIPSEETLVRLNTPVANNRDEWAEAFLVIAQTVIEKFRPKALRELLDQRGITHDKDDKSLSLLEKLVAPNRLASERKPRLDGLREAQTIRSKARAHDGGKEGIAASQTALMEHGTYRSHFEHVCNVIADELEEIEACIANAPAKPVERKEQIK